MKDGVQTQPKQSSVSYLSNVEDLLPNQNINYGLHEAEVQKAQKTELIEGLDLSKLPIHVDVKNIDTLPNKDYALVRRNGFGCSDSSVILGVNPYKNILDLIGEKASPQLSAEEIAVGSKIAVRKGNDLEPLIIDKYAKFFQTPVIKPKDMYQHNDYPYFKINFDGVALRDGVYFPVEIKVCTSYGEKHYDKAKATFDEFVGLMMPQDNVSSNNWDIYTKAAHYGIPPYYYTQIQAEMLALDAEFGYLCVLFEKDWCVRSFLIWRDVTVQTEFIKKADKTWKKVEELRAKKGLTYEDFIPKGTEQMIKGTRPTSIFDYVDSNITYFNAEDL